MAEPRQVGLEAVGDSDDVVADLAEPAMDLADPPARVLFLIGRGQLVEFFQGDRKFNLGFQETPDVPVVSVDRILNYRFVAFADADLHLQYGFVQRRNDPAQVLHIAVDPSHQHVGQERAHDQKKGQSSEKQSQFDLEIHCNRLGRLD